MEGNLRVITGPALEPVTVADVKLHAHVDVDVEDSLIATWIRTAREFAEGFQSKAYITQELQLSLDCWPSAIILLPRSPVQSVTEILYYDIYNTEYELDLTTVYIDTDTMPARIMKGYGISWPSVTLRTIAGIKIRYTAGYCSDPSTILTTPESATTGQVPADVIDAIMLYCTYRNENRTGESDPPKAFYDILRSGGRLYT